MFGHNVIHAKGIYLFYYRYNLRFKIASAGSVGSAFLQQAVEDAVTAVLDRHLEQINNTLNDLKADLSDLKGDVRLVARNTALVHFLSNST